MTTHEPRPSREKLGLSLSTTAGLSASGLF